jgi:carboxylate-amine ligase
MAQLVFGMHIHVAIDDAERPSACSTTCSCTCRSYSRQRFIAVLARRADGLASTRQLVFAAFPRSGPPPRFRDYADYARVVGQLERTGCVPDYTQIWWDIRPHPRLGTIEVRICDAVTRVEDAIAIAAFCQSLVKLYCERFERGEEIQSYHRILTSENKWLAARHGLEAPLMDLATGGNRVPVTRLVASAPRRRPRASSAATASWRRPRVLARGSSADHQLRIFNANRDIVEVVREIAEQTESTVALA